MRPPLLPVRKCRSFRIFLLFRVLSPWGFVAYNCQLIFFLGSSKVFRLSKFLSKMYLLSSAQRREFPGYLFNFQPNLNYLSSPSKPVSNVQILLFTPQYMYRSHIFKAQL